MFTQASLPKSGTALPSLLLTTSEKSLPTTLNFNYQIVVGLDPVHFKLEKPNSDLNLYKIRLSRNPKHWSPSEIDQLTIDMCSKSACRSYGNKEAKRELYLNSKALVDRLFLQLSASLRFEWPKRQKRQQLNPHIHKIQIIGEDPTLDLKDLRRRSSLFNRRSSSQGLAKQEEEVDQERTCGLESNRIRIEFKWKGNKPHFKNLKVFITISVVSLFYNDKFKDSIFFK